MTNQDLVDTADKLFKFLQQDTVIGIISEIFRNNPGENDEEKIKKLIAQEIIAKVGDREICNFDDLDFSTGQRTSANCVFFIRDNNRIFLKVQENEMQDPLINEVVAIQVLNKLEQDRTPKIFIEYKDHCIYAHPAPITIAGATLQTSQFFNTLSTQYHAMTPLWQYMKTKISNGWVKDDRLLPAMENLAKAYKNLASKHYMTHNDLHVNNIMVLNSSIPSQNELDIRIIDYGRVWFSDSVYTEDVNELIKDSEKKYNRLDGYYESKRKSPDLRKFQITHESGYICDVATLAFNAVFFLEDYDWPSWCTRKVLTTTNQNGQANRELGFIFGPQIDALNYVFNEPNNSRTAVRDGLAWLTNYATEFFKIVPSFIEYPLNASSTIKDIKVNQFFMSLSTLQRTVLIKNNCFDPRPFLHIIRKLNNTITDFLNQKQNRQSQSGGRDTNCLTMRSTSRKCTTEKINCMALKLEKVECMKKKQDICYSDMTGIGGAAIDKFEKQLKPYATVTSVRDLSIDLKEAYMDKNKDIPPEVNREHRNFLSAGLRTPLTDQELNGINKFLNAINIENTTKSNKAVPAKSASAQGAKSAKGGSPHHKTTYAVRVEKGTHRKYVMRSNRKWYLDEHRGKFRYVVAGDKSLITMRKKEKVYK